MSINHFDNELVSVIIRFHDIKRIDYLDQCLFSLVGQQYDEVEVIIATQNFGEAETRRVNQTIERYASYLTAIRAINVTLDGPGMPEARSLTTVYRQRPVVIWRS